MKKAQTPVKYDKESVKKLYKLSGILSKELGVTHHVDHIKPLSKGGLHHESNLQIIIAKQNLSKGVNKVDNIKGITVDDLRNFPDIFDVIIATGLKK